MSSRLDAIQDLEARAQEARYCVATLARNLQIVERQLRRYIRARWDLAPVNGSTRCVGWSLDIFRWTPPGAGARLRG